MGSKWRTRKDGFEPSRRCQQQVIGGACRSFGFVVGERHPVERHNFKCLSIKLQVQIAIGRGVHDTPELPLFGRDLDSRTKGPIDGKDFLDCLRFSPTSLRWDFYLMLEFSCPRIMVNRAAAHNEHTLTKPSYLRSITFYSLDDYGSRHSVQHLPVTFAMRMSVVPEQARGMIARNLNRVVQNLARHGQHSEHVILRGVRRDSEPMKMQVSHVHAGIHRTSFRGLGRKIVDVVDSENVPWGSTDHRGHSRTIESEGISPILIHRVQRK